MERWQRQLNANPIPPLLDSGNDPILYFTRRDLLDEVGSAEELWNLPAVERILKRQQENGAWKYPGGGKEHHRAVEDYDQLETFRILGQLVEKYGLDKRHLAIRRAADFLFSRQTVEGDFRGIYGNQYTPNYSAAIMELLIKAGYATDARIQKGFRWLLSIRQSDGGWAIPISTVGAKWDVKTLGGETIKPGFIQALFPHGHWGCVTCLCRPSKVQQVKRGDDRRETCRVAFLPQRHISREGKRLTFGPSSHSRSGSPISYRRLTRSPS